MINPKKKIAFVIGSLTSGGSERVISTLSNRLVDSFDVCIITFKKTEPFYTLNNKVKVISCYDSLKRPSNFLASLWLNIALVKRICEIIRSEKIDLLIGFITTANILSIIASNITGIPSVISERNNPQMEIIPKFWKFLREFFYPRANSVVLQTQGVKKLYEKKVSESKLIILPNPISEKLTNKRTFKDDSKREKLILNVGRLNKSKQQKMLINAFENITTEDWKLLIIGDGPQYNALQKQIKQLKLSDKVEIKPQIKDIHNYYDKARVFAFTSKNEGFPNALIEAMHFGLPSISTDCDFGPSDLINHNSNGILIPVNGQLELEQSLQLLINDKSLREKISKNAIASTEEYISFNVITKWQKLINDILSQVN